VSDRFEFIDAEHAASLANSGPGLPIVRMCALMEVSRSGFYDWRDRPASATAERREELRLFIARLAGGGARVLVRPQSSAAVTAQIASAAMSSAVCRFRRGSPLTSAPTYLPACSHGSGRAKCGRGPASSSDRFRPASPAPILAAAAAFRSCRRHTHDRQATAPHRTSVPATAPPLKAPIRHRPSVRDQPPLAKHPARPARPGQT
jgi:hypothetical protein